MAGKTVIIISRHEKYVEPYGYTPVIYVFDDNVYHYPEEEREVYIVLGVAQDVSKNFTAGYEVIHGDLAIRVDNSSHLVTRVQHNYTR